MGVVDPHTIDGGQFGITPLSIALQCINDAEFALVGHINIDFRRRNIVREAGEQLFGAGFLLAEDLQQARGAVDAIVKAVPALLDEDMATHFAGQQSACFLHLLLDQRMTGLPH
ncbi:hypothetical protein D3C81_1334150 [compost metagenome]